MYGVSRSRTAHQGQEGYDGRQALGEKTGRVRIESRGCQSGEAEAGQGEPVGHQHAHLPEGARANWHGSVQRRQRWQGVVQMCEAKNFLSL